MVLTNRIFVAVLPSVFLTLLTLTGTVSAGTPKASKNEVNITNTLPQTNRIDVEWNLLNLNNKYLNKFRVDYVDSGGKNVSCFVDASDDPNQQTYTTKDLSDCPSTLTPCAKYNITVQPIGNANQTIGVKDEEKDYTLPQDMSDTQLTCTALKDDNGVLSIQVTVNNPCVDHSVSWTGDILWDPNDTIPPGSGVITDGFYVIKDVVPYTNYTITVSYDSNSTADDVTCYATTDELPPTAPQSVNVFSDSDVAKITVTWKTPEEINGVLDHYTVSYTPVNGNTSTERNTNKTFLELNNLVFCEEYSIMVSATTGGGEGDYSSPLPGTATDGPPTDVQDFHYDQIGSDSVNLVWKRPDTKCNVTEYFITYEGINLWSDDNPQKVQVTVPGDETTKEITEMTPYSNYTFYIFASNDEGNGTAAESNLISFEGTPTAPNNVKVETFNESSLMVTWKEPEKMNGVLDYYTVTYNTGDDNGNETVNGVQYNLENLTPCRVYDISVTATSGGSGVGGGGTSEPASGEGTTDPPQLNATFSVDDQVINIVWEYLGPNCPLTSYELRWTEEVLWSEEINEADETLDTILTSYALVDTTPYSQYNVSIAAVIGDLKGAAKISGPLQTLEEAPTAPNDVKVETVGESSLKVTWNEPEKMNGVLANYTVTYKTGDDDGAKNVTKTELKLENLTPCRIYDISVTATSGGSDVGGGGTSEREEDEGTTDPPKLDATFSVNDQVINIEWVSLGTYCPLTSYELRWTEEVLWSDEMNKNNNTLGKDETSYELDDTTPYSEYNVSIAAVVGDVKGDDATSGPLQTLEKPPSKPRNLNCLSSNETSLTIEWDKPTELNGKPIYYTVSWNKTDQTPYEDNVTANIQSDHFTHVIAQLESGTEYTVAVKLMTVEYGNQEDDLYSTLVGEASNVVGIVVGVVVFLLIAVILAVLFIKREDIKKKIDENKTRKNPTAVHNQTREMNSIPVYGSNQRYFSNMIVETEKTIQEMSNPADLVQMFNELNAASADRPKNVSTNGVNNSKNRYANILPFDHSRVLLANKDLSSDYINANQIKDKKEATVIASQGPTMNTLEDFWTMIYEQNVSLIVMLTKCYENKKEKCYKYWPDRKGSPFQVYPFDIHLMDEEETNGCTMRKLSLMNKQMNSEKTVTQFHYLHWPDYGVPAREEDLLLLVQKARDFALEQNSPKVVVHCSAGVGRTGTFISLWHLQHDVEIRKPDVDVRKTVLKIREDREKLVQSKEQYHYLYKCFLKYLENRSDWSFVNNDGGSYSDQLQGANNYSYIEQPPPAASRPQRISSPMSPPSDARSHNSPGSVSPVPPSRDYRGANQSRITPPRSPYGQGGNMNKPPPPRRPIYE